MEIRNLQYSADCAQISGDIADPLSTPSQAHWQSQSQKYKTQFWTAMMTKSTVWQYPQNRPSSSNAVRLAGCDPISPSSLSVHGMAAAARILGPQFALFPFFCCLVACCEDAAVRAVGYRVLLNVQVVSVGLSIFPSLTASVSMLTEPSSLQA